MIFNRKKKINSKVRFQHKQFTGQLKTARTYKRQVKAKSDTNLNTVLSKIGLGSRWRLALFLGVLAGVIYLVYVPNFLTIQTVSISGLSDQDRQRAVKAINEKIESASIFNPQSNILFTRRSIVTQALDGLGSIQSVGQIKKDYKNRALVIEVEAKYTKFLLVTESQVYDVFNDGQLRGLSGISFVDWQSVNDSNLIKILVKGDLDNAQSQLTVVDQQAIGRLMALGDELSTLTEFKLDYFDFRPEAKKALILQNAEGVAVIPEPADGSNDAEKDNIEQSLQSDLENTESTESKITKLELPLKAIEIKAVLTKVDGSIRPFVVYFDTQTDVALAVRRLTSLLSQTSLDRLANLDYIDMRIDGKAFLCLRNTICAK